MLTAILSFYYRRVIPQVPCLHMWLFQRCVPWPWSWIILQEYLILLLSFPRLSKNICSFHQVNSTGLCPFSVFRQEWSNIPCIRRDLIFHINYTRFNSKISLMRLLFISIQGPSLTPFGIFLYWESQFFVIGLGKYICTLTEAGRFPFKVYKWSPKKLGSRTNEDIIEFVIKFVRMYVCSPHKVSYSLTDAGTKNKISAGTCLLTIEVAHSPYSWFAHILLHLSLIPHRSLLSRINSRSRDSLPEEM